MPVKILIDVFFSLKNIEVHEVTLVKEQCILYIRTFILPEDDKRKEQMIC